MGSLKEIALKLIAFGFNYQHVVKLGLQHNKPSQVKTKDSDNRGV